MAVAAKQPNERYRIRGRTRYIGVDCWSNDKQAKDIAKEARKQGVTVIAQFDLAQNCTYLYVPEKTYIHDAGVIFSVQDKLVPVK